MANARSNQLAHFTGIQKIKIKIKIKDDEAILEVKFNSFAMARLRFPKRHCGLGSITE